MLIVQGFFKDATPHCKIKISGLNPATALEFDAVIDTGFDGFISMPANAALQVGLVGRITTDLILANNSVEPTLAAQGTVHLADLSAQGMIILQEDSQEVLAGMGFLVTLGLALVLTTTQIALMSEQELRRQAEERARIDSRPESTLAEAEVRLSKAQSEIAEADEAAAD